MEGIITRHTLLVLIKNLNRIASYPANWDKESVKVYNDNEANTDVNLIGAEQMSSGHVTID